MGNLEGDMNNMNSGMGNKDGDLGILKIVTNWKEVVIGTPQGDMDAWKHNQKLTDPFFQMKFDWKLWELPSAIVTRI